MQHSTAMQTMVPLVMMPKELADLKIEIGAGTYRMGIGGLHSCESRQVVRADDDMLLLDRDVASYYPAIIIGSFQSLRNASAPLRYG